MRPNHAPTRKITTLRLLQRLGRMITLQKTNISSYFIYSYTALSSLLITLKIFLCVLSCSFLVSKHLSNSHFICYILPAYSHFKSNYISNSTCSLTVTSSNIMSHYNVYLTSLTNSSNNYYYQLPHP